MSFQVLEESVAFLEGELKKRGVVTDETIKKLKQELLEDMADLEMTPKASWIPENFSNGDWLLGPTVMD